MEYKLIELTNKNDVLEAYDIYKHCMYMPTESTFHKKIDGFFNDSSVKIFACYSKDKLEGIIVVSFVKRWEIEILGIAVDISVRNKGVGSYMINQLVNDYNLHSIYAETDIDAVGFYCKNGFAISEFKKTYNGDTYIRYQCTFSK